MKRLLTFGALMALAGCQAVPPRSDYTLHLDGDWRAIAECVYPNFRDQGWTMIVLETRQQAEISWAVDGAPMGRIEVRHAGEGKTDIVSFQIPTIWNKRLQEQLQGPIFEQCSKQLAAVSRPSSR